MCDLTHSSTAAQCSLTSEQLYGYELFTSLNSLVSSALPGTNPAVEAHWATFTDMPTLQNEKEESV